MVCEETALGWRIASAEQSHALGIKASQAFGYGPIACHGRSRELSFQRPVPTESLHDGMHFCRGLVAVHPSDLKPVGDLSDARVGGTIGFERGDLCGVAERDECLALDTLTEGWCDSPERGE